MTVYLQLFTSRKTPNSRIHKQSWFLFFFTPLIGFYKMNITLAALFIKQTSLFERYFVLSLKASVLERVECICFLKSPPHMYIVLIFARETKCLIILLWKNSPTTRNTYTCRLISGKKNLSFYLKYYYFNMSIFIIQLARIMFHFRSDR